MNYPKTAQSENRFESLLSNNRSDAIADSSSTFAPANRMEPQQRESQYSQANPPANVPKANTSRVAQLPTELLQSNGSYMPGSTKRIY
ncbi:MAG: hypothetical protein R3C03_19285 [Pirellulaceae bacterium]